MEFTTFKPIRTRFGRFMYDGYAPSNIEILFEFLTNFDEVPLPDGKTYRIVDNTLQVKEHFVWEDDECVNYLMGLVKDFNCGDWGELERNSKKDNVIRFDSWTVRKHFKSTR